MNLYSCDAKHIEITLTEADIVKLKKQGKLHECKVDNLFSNTGVSVAVFYSAPVKKPTLDKPICYRSVSKLSVRTK